MKWSHFFGGVLIGVSLGIMLGVAVAPGSGPENVTTSTAGFCTLLMIAGVAPIVRELRRSHLKEAPAEKASTTGSADE